MSSPRGTGRSSPTSCPAVNRGSWRCAGCCTSRMPSRSTYSTRSIPPRIGMISGKPCRGSLRRDRKSTRLNSSHADISPLPLPDALPIWLLYEPHALALDVFHEIDSAADWDDFRKALSRFASPRSEEHTSELQSRRHLPSSPPRRSSDLVVVRAACPRARRIPRDRFRRGLG